MKNSVRLLMLMIFLQSFSFHALSQTKSFFSVDNIVPTNEGNADIYVEGSILGVKNNLFLFSSDNWLYSVLGVKSTDTLSLTMNEFFTYKGCENLIPHDKKELVDHLGEPFEMVVKRTKQFNVNLKYCDKDWDIFLAARYNLTNKISSFIANGVDVNSINSIQDFNKGESVLQIALYFANEKAAKFLISKGANINIQGGKVNGTPLMSTAHKDGALISTAKLLIEKKANLEAKDNNGHTTLHKASYLGQLELARLLIDAGANINSKGNFGETPLMLAVQGNKPNIVEYLVQQGADTSIDSKGWTALKLAEQSGYKEIVQILQKGKQ